MNTLTTAPFNHRKPINLNDCFVRNPQRWVVLFPECQRPVVVDTAPPRGWGKVIGTAHTERTALRICDEWERQREIKIERRHKALCHAAYTFALGCLLLALTLAGGVSA